MIISVRAEFVTDGLHQRGSSFVTDKKQNNGTAQWRVDFLQSQSVKIRARTKRRSQL